MSAGTVEAEKKTPRACAACGGRSCNWCTGGFQDEAQQAKWKEFRSRMRTISSTYPLLENITRQLIQALEDAGTDEALELAQKGRQHLDRWIMSDCDTAERRAASVEIGIFQTDALIVITKAKRGV